MSMFVGVCTRVPTATTISWGGDEVMPLSIVGGFLLKKIEGGWQSMVNGLLTALTADYLKDRIADLWFSHNEWVHDSTLEWHGMAEVEDIKRLYPIVGAYGVMASLVDVSPTLGLVTVDA